MKQHHTAELSGDDTRERSHAHPDLLTAAEVALLLSVPESWVYAAARAGRIPYVALGRYVRFRPAAVEAWIADREQPSYRTSP